MLGSKHKFLRQKGIYDSRCISTLSLFQVFEQLFKQSMNSEGVKNHFNFKKYLLLIAVKHI